MTDARITAFQRGFRRLSLYDYRVRAHYKILAGGGSLAEASRYMNMGYWKAQPKTLDQAAQALVRLVGETAELQKDDRVLDVGCGFGDQDIFWARTYSPARIDAVNTSEYQLGVAAKRLAEANLSKTICLWAASATDLPFDSMLFDKVLCVEAAHHFDTREDFFHETHRVLKARGKLVSADIVLRSGCRLGTLARQNMHIRKANMYDAQTYAVKLENAGFDRVDVRSIREHVYEPFSDFLLQRIEHPDMARRLNGLFHRLARLYVRKLTQFADLDFVIAVAERGVL